MALTRISDDNIEEQSLVRTYANAAYQLANTVSQTAITTTSTEDFDLGLNSNQIITVNSQTVFNSIAKEKITTTANAASNTINFDVLSQSILYYTSNSTNNWILNIRGDSSNTLNSLINVNQSLTVIFLSTQGATAYYQSNLQIDSTNVEVKWQGGSAPTQGNANSVDLYAINIIKTGSSQYLVMESQTQFK